MNEYIKTIRKLIPKTEILLQLAEESNELAIASINFRKTIDYDNSIYYSNYSNFIEEIADVKLCIDIIGGYDNIKSVKISSSKYKLFEILIKDCCELSKYSIKYRRTIVDSAIPTPMTEDEVKLKLIEILSNIKSCINYIGDYWDCDDVNNVYKEKIIRLINRINNK